MLPLRPRGRRGSGCGGGALGSELRRHPPHPPVAIAPGPLVSLGCGLMRLRLGVKSITPSRDAAETVGPLSREACEGARLTLRPLRKPEQLPGITSRTCKAGTRKMADIVITAGIDVSKDRLDVALWPAPGARCSFRHDEIEPLIMWLGEHRVVRVGVRGEAPSVDKRD